MIKDLIVNLSVGAPRDTAADFALSIAEAFEAHVAGIAFAIWWGRSKNTEAVRRVVDPIKLRIPVFGKLNKKIALTRFTRNFAQTQAGKTTLSAKLAKCRLHQRTPGFFFLLRSNAHHDA